MNRLIFKKSSEEGDIILRGNDGPVRVFSQALSIVPYFCGMINVEGSLKPEHNFQQFTAVQLEEFTAYLCGINPDKYSDSFFEVLDYFQVPVLDINIPLNSSTSAALSIKWIVKCETKGTDYDSDQWKWICKKIIDEREYLNPEVIQWLKRANNNYIELPIRRYRKVKLLERLCQENYEKLLCKLKEYYGESKWQNKLWKLCSEVPYSLKEELLAFLGWIYDNDKKGTGSEEEEEPKEPKKPKVIVNTVMLARRMVLSDEDEMKTPERISSDEEDSEEDEKKKPKKVMRGAVRAVRRVVSSDEEEPKRVVRAVKRASPLDSDESLNDD